MQIDYFLETVVNGSLEIEDYANCAVEANDDIGNFYYIIVKTDLGISNILEFGPINKYEKPGTAYTKYKMTETNEKKIKTAISELLNNSFRKITQAKEISIEEALDKIPDYRKYLEEENMVV